MATGLHRWGRRCQAAVCREEGRQELTSRLLTSFALKVLFSGDRDSIVIRLRDVCSRAGYRTWGLKTEIIKIRDTLTIKRFVLIRLHGLDDVKEILLQQKAASQTNLLVVLIKLPGRIFTALVSTVFCGGRMHEVHEG